MCGSRIYVEIHISPSPGAGTKPPALAGRDNELERFRILIGRLQADRHEKSMLITGLRGVGKTVLLNTFSDIAIEAGWHAMSAVERVRDRARRALGVLSAFVVR